MFTHTRVKEFTKANLASLKFDPAGPALQFAWEDKLTGFGVRISPSNELTFVASRAIRGRNKTRRKSLDKCNKQFDHEPSRKKARDYLKRMADGEDPWALAEDKRGKTVAEAIAAFKDKPGLSKASKGDIDNAKKWLGEIRDSETHEVLLASWLDRKLFDVARHEVNDRHKAIARIVAKQNEKRFSAATRARLLVRRHQHR
jgi:hypothetical protein